MFDSKTILIVDVNTYNSLDLAAAVEERQGRVAGPVSTADETLTVLDSDSVAAAVVDCDSDGADEIVRQLVARGIPTVVQTSTRNRAELEDSEDRISILVKPVDVELVLATLLNAIGLTAAGERSIT